MRVSFAGFFLRNLGGTPLPRGPTAGLTVAALFLSLPLTAVQPDSSAAVIRNVKLSRPFFNPTLAQKVQISFDISRAGRLSLAILDRDGFVVRALASQKPMLAGSSSFEWDGRDEKGRILPDEAFSAKIDLRFDGGTASYFPASQAAPHFEVEAHYYDRRRAVLSYTLPQPSRVHIQAGTARIDPKTRKPLGPVLKTVVNREPRVAGRVIEFWNGLDESGTIFVPDLKEFKLGIAATPLPENAVLTTGNRGPTFVEYAKTRTGSSLLPAAHAGHHSHHSGLDVFNDVAPALRVRPQNAKWSSSDRVWRATGPELLLKIGLEGPTADAFSRQPGSLIIFLGLDVAKKISPGSRKEIEVPVSPKLKGRHIVAINWASDYGPVAVSALQVDFGRQQNRAPESKKRSPVEVGQAERFAKELSDPSRRGLLRGANR